MRRRFSFVLSLSLVILGSRVAGADPDPQSDQRPLPRPVRLVYSLRPGVDARSCTDAETVERAITNHVRGKGYRGLFDRDAPAQLLVTISRQGIWYTATADVHDKDGNSAWKASFKVRDNCDMLVLDIGLTVGERFSDPTPEAAEALAATPTTTATSSATTTTSPTTTTTSSEPSKQPVVPSKEETKLGVLPLVQPDASGRPKSPQRRWAARVSASGGVSRGESPAKAEAVVSLEGGLQWRFLPNWMLSTTAGVVWRPRASALMPAQGSLPPVEVGTTVISGVFAPCVRGRIVRVWAFGCTGIELGGWFADAANIRHPASAVTLWAALDPRLGIEVPLGPVPRGHLPQLAFLTYGDLPVMLHRPKALVGEGPSMSSGRMTEVLVTPPVTGAFHVGLAGWFGL